MTENLKNLITFIFGSVAMSADLLKLGTGFIGIVGAVLMVLAGWELWQTRKVERQIKQLELDQMRAQIPTKEL